MMVGKESLWYAQRIKQAINKKGEEGIKPNSLDSILPDFLTTIQKELNDLDVRSSIELMSLLEKILIKNQSSKFIDKNIKKNIMETYFKLLHHTALKFTEHSFQLFLNMKDEDIKNLSKKENYSNQVVDKEIKLLEECLPVDIFSPENGLVESILAINRWALIAEECYKNKDFHSAKSLMTIIHLWHIDKLTEYTDEKKRKINFYPEEIKELSTKLFKLTVDMMRGPGIPYLNYYMSILSRGKEALGLKSGENEKKIDIEDNASKMELLLKQKQEDVKKLFKNFSIPEEGFEHLTEEWFKPFFKDKEQKHENKQEESLEPSLRDSEEKLLQFPLEDKEKKSLEIASEEWMQSESDKRIKEMPYPKDPHPEALKKMRDTSKLISDLDQLNKHQLNEDVYQQYGNALQEFKSNRTFTTFKSNFSDLSFSAFTSISDLAEERIELIDEAIKELKTQTKSAKTSLIKAENPKEEIQQLKKIKKCLQNIVTFEMANLKKLEQLQRKTSLKDMRTSFFTRKNSFSIKTDTPLATPKINNSDKKKQP